MDYRKRFREPPVGCHCTISSFTRLPCTPGGRRRVLLHACGLQVWHRGRCGPNLITKWSMTTVGVEFLISCTNVAFVRTGSHGNGQKTQFSSRLTSLKLSNNVKLNWVNFTGWNIFSAAKDLSNAQCGITALIICAFSRALRVYRFRIRWIA